MSIRLSVGSARTALLFLSLVAILLVAVACTPIVAPTPAPQEEPDVAQEVQTPSPEPEAAPTESPSTEMPPMESPPTEPPSAEEESESGSGTVDLDAIFPQDREYERNLTMISCGSCHSWACAVMGQRPVAHWRTTKANHRDLVSGMSDEDYDRLFAFLSENFNDTQPEPPLPEALRQLGCTTQQ